MAATIRVQTEDFDAGDEIAALRAGKPEVGAVVCFIGAVRDTLPSREAAAKVLALTIEHYPGMTESALQDICSEAESRWELIDTLVIHRYGELAPQDQIVLVAVTSAHRGEAFAACEFIIDFLKTQAPFWKKETTAAGASWVAARSADASAADRWSSTAPTSKIPEISE